MKKLLALVVILAVLMAGCLGGDGDNKNDERANCTWTLPHARIVHATAIDYGDIPAVKVANFSTFQELANGVVYAVDVYGLSGAVLGLDLVYIRQDMVFIYYLSFENCTGGRLIIENNTIKVEG